MQEEESPTPQSDSEDNDFDDGIVIEDEDEQPKDTIKRLRDKLKECTAQKQEYLDGWQRAKADIVNNRKEFTKERERIQARTNEEVIASLLPVLDSFEMAFSDEKKWNDIDEQWRSGIEHIHSQLVNTIKSYGVESISPQQGDIFDPQRHTSVDTVSTEKDDQDNTVARCEKTGYRMNDRIIRSANVVVYKSKS
jgi:molecular chaperone GrpE